MTKDDIAKRVAAALEAEFHRYRNAELQHITAVNDGQHRELQALPVPTDDESREAYKDREFSWMRYLFGQRLDLDYSAGLLLGFSLVMTEHAIFVANKSNLKLPSSLRTRPISGVLVKAFTDMRDEIANSDINKPSVTTYAVGELIEWAKGKGFVADEVLAEWEAYNKSDESKQTEQPAASAPVMADSGSDAPDWTVKPPQRYRGYGWPLHRLLTGAHQDGKPRPTARDVVEAWRINKPAEVAKVLPDGFDYYDAKGNTKPADLEAIRKAIDRMISAR